MTQRLHALLIGIDHYLPHELPDGGFYPNLRGSVRDVTAMEQFLRCRLRVPAERITTLTTTDADRDEPTEERERWPTYENMVAAIKRLTATAEPGDEVLASERVPAMPAPPDRYELSRLIRDVSSVVVSSRSRPLPQGGRPGPPVDGYPPQHPGALVLRSANP